MNLFKRKSKKPDVSSEGSGASPETVSVTTEVSAPPGSGTPEQSVKGQPSSVDASDRASALAPQDRGNSQPADGTAAEGGRDPSAGQGQDGKDAKAGENALLSIFEEEEEYGDPIVREMAGEVEDVTAHHLLGEIASLSMEIEDRIG